MINVKMTPHILKNNMYAWLFAMCVYAYVLRWRVNESVLYGTRAISIDVDLRCLILWLLLFKRGWDEGSFVCTAWLVLLLCCRLRRRLFPFILPSWLVFFPSSASCHTLYILWHFSMPIFPTTTITLCSSIFQWESLNWQIGYENAFNYGSVYWN